MTEFEATITDLSHDGRGVARIDNKATFVSGALPGERVLLKYRKRHRNYDDAEVVSVIEASPDRVEPKCRHFGQCSGCSLQHLAPAAQIAAKQNVLAENFERIGKVTPESWLPPLTDQPWSYRRKGRFSVRFVTKKGRVLVGFREESNPAFVADIEQCEVIHPAIGPKVGLLASVIQTLDVARDIPQVEFAAGDDTVALVFRHLSPMSDKDKTTLTAFAREHGFAIYLQPGNHSSVHPLWPESPRLAFAIPADNVELEFLPLDFVQVNAGMNQRMLARTLELLDLRPEHRVLDLFCGLGNFTLPIARHVAEVVGVEGEHGLVERAAANAARNGIANASFRVANLFEDQRKEPWAKEKWDRLLLDPPRAGADKLLEYLPRKGTDRIVYVSCHPGSLARDAGILVEKHGFRLVSAGVMDMFPHTARVRRSGDKAWLNIKSATLGIERQEYEYVIPLDDALHLLGLCDGVLEKHRHHVMVDGAHFEVDEFHGDNEGLVVAEIELASADAAYPRPGWLGKEVSDQVRYYNVNLIERPFSIWTAAEREGKEDATC